MKEQLRTFPFRWLLPLLQFSLCLISLWPYRDILVFELSSSIRAYAPAQSGTASSRPQHIDIPTLTPEEQTAFDRGAKTDILRMRVPVVLNFPVVILQLPYVILNPEQTEWVPKEMLADTWRAMSWPFAGVLFWWSLGRGIEALSSSRKAIISPRVTLPETIFAAVLVCFGVAEMVMTVTATPDHRAELRNMVLPIGGILWGVLASLTIVARISQWKILRKAEVVRSLT